jgi:hypothetical protein
VSEAFRPAYWRLSFSPGDAGSLIRRRHTDRLTCHRTLLLGVLMSRLCQVGLLKAGKAEADDRVERSLYQRAVGYEYDAVKIFCDTSAPANSVTVVASAAANFVVVWAKSNRKTTTFEAISRKHTDELKGSGQGDVCFTPNRHVSSQRSCADHLRQKSLNRVGDSSL